MTGVCLSENDNLWFYFNSPWLPLEIIELVFEKLMSFLCAFAAQEII